MITIRKNTVITQKNMIKNSQSILKPKTWKHKKDRRIRNNNGSTKQLKNNEQNGNSKSYLLMITVSINWLNYPNPLTQTYRMAEWI